MSRSDPPASSAGTGSSAREVEEARQRWQRDVGIVGCLCALFLAVRWLHNIPWVMGAVLLVAAAITVRPRLILLALLLLLGARGGAVVDSLEPASSRPVVAERIELATDPVPNERGWNAIARLDEDLLWLSVSFSADGQFGELDASDHLVISGDVRSGAPETDWAIANRIVGDLNVSDVHQTIDASGLAGAANALRSLYDDGAEHLDPTDQALFTGLVFGDDRHQDPVDADNFRAAGLGHLLAVSGQNVAFVLLLAAPILARLRNVFLRVPVSIALLLGFGLITRFEASVTRAIVMAGLALIAHGAGRESQAAVVLVPAVLLLLALDPLLGWSLAFQLSVAATTGMIVLTARVAAILPGPAPLRRVVAATLAAQLFVAPLLLAAFGQLSVVSVPANVLAAPAAAGAMMWGLVAGPIAGVGPTWLATILHTPTSMLIWWLSLVAGIFAGVDVGNFGTSHLFFGAVGLAILLGGPQLGSRVRLHPIGIVLVALSLGIPLLTPSPLAPGVHQLSPEIVIARSPEGHDFVVLQGNVRLDDALEQLRISRTGRIDLLVSTSGSRRMGLIVRVLSERFEVGTIWAPIGHAIPGAVSMETMTGSLGTLDFSVDESGDIRVVNRS